MNKKKEIVELVRLKRKAVKENASRQFLDNIQRIISDKTSELIENRSNSTQDSLKNTCSAVVLDFKSHKK